MDIGNTDCTRSGSPANETELLVLSLHFLRSLSSSVLCALREKNRIVVSPSKAPHKLGRILPYLNNDGSAGARPRKPLFDVSNDGVVSLLLCDANQLLLDEGERAGLNLKRLWMQELYGVPVLYREMYAQKRCYYSIT